MSSSSEPSPESDSPDDSGGRHWSFMLRLVYRFLFRSRSVGVLPWLTLFAMLSVAVGVATLIISFSVFNGFSTSVQEQLVNVYSPLRIYSNQGEALVLDRLRSRLAKWVDPDRVVGVHRGEVLFRGPSGGYQGGQVRSYTRWMRGRFNIRDLPDTGILLGQGLARSLGVLPGEDVLVIRPNAQDTPFGFLPGGQKLEVQQIVRTGFRELNRYLAILPWSVSRSLFDRREGRASFAEIWLRDRNRASSLKQLLQKKYPEEYFFVTWQEANPAMFEALKLERTVMFLVLTMIILVAAINILSMLVLSILQRRRQIAVMMAMGAGPRTILGLFLAAGLSITVVGLGIGFGLGLGGCYLLDNVFVIELPPVYPMRQLPIQVEPLYLGLIAGVTLLLGFASSFYPAWKASRIDPAEVLRGG